ncbi:MAG: hypothetical protein HKO57_12115, partial [Akkermansiaceae bacterium]|nr:hypothetical protein [Akkermansiaceae bacterium]
MAPAKTPSRRLARRIFIFLLLAGGILFGVWWQFVRPGTNLAPLGGSPNVPPPPAFEKFEEERPLMGTLFRIVAYGTEGDATRRAMSEAFRRADEIATACSDYDPQSELSMLG